MYILSVLSEFNDLFSNMENDALISPQVYFHAWWSAQCWESSQRFWAQQTDPFEMFAVIRVFLNAMK